MDVPLLVLEGVQRLEDGGLGDEVLPLRGEAGLAEVNKQLIKVNKQLITRVLTWRTVEVR